MTARRTLGRLGAGGGPGMGEAIFPRSCGTMFGKTEMLQVGKSNARPQRGSVQACPGAALEVTEPQFLLQLLVCLFADPTRRDRRGETTQ